MGFDPPAGTWLAGTLPLWAAGVAAALFVVAVVVALRRSAATGIFPTALRYSVILIGALVVLTFLDRATMRDRQAERRSLESRTLELTGRAIVPGSPLACLDAGAGDEVERACERAVFANPETVAAAVSYVAARFALFAEGLDYAAHDSAYATQLNGTRKALEADRFGLLAHVLATREGCVADNCPALKRLGDAGRVQQNLRAGTYAAQVARYVPVWTGRPGALPPVSSAAPPDSAPVAAAPGPTSTTATVAGSASGEARPVSSLPNIDFPSASSIPPVSIMNAEPAPGAPAAPAAAAPAAAPKPAVAAAPTPPRRPPAPARRATPAAEQPGAPVQIAPVTPTPFDNAGQPPAASGQ